MQRQFFFFSCSLVVLLAGCPKDKDGVGGAATEDGGSANASGGTSGSESHSGGTSGGTGGHDAMGSGGHSSSGGHDSMGVDAGSGQSGHDAPGTGGTAAADGGPATDAGSTTDPSCADQDCDAGTHCELVQVQCIRAPCPPQPECVKDSTEKRFCGGIAAGAFPCPGMSECVDDPDDDCDPKNGGADCGGLCECSKAATCVKGKHWNGSPDVCACQADDGSDDGPACGKKHCVKGMECCNASCGTCVMPGFACDQIACTDDT